MSTSKLPAAPFSAPLPAWVHAPHSDQFPTQYDPSTPWGNPLLPGMISMGSVPGMRPPIGDAWAANVENTHSSCSGAHLTWHDSAREMKAEGGSWYFSVVSPGGHSVEPDETPLQLPSHKNDFGGEK